jgi:hypothetical protein
LWAAIPIPCENPKNDDRTFGRRPPYISFFCSDDFDPKLTLIDFPLYKKTAGVRWGVAVFERIELSPKEEKEEEEEVQR